MTPEPAPGAGRRRRTLPGVAAILALGLLAACGTAASDDDARLPALSAAPAPERESDADAPELPDVPVTKAVLPQVKEVVPPTGLTIDALGIALPVESVGVREDGQMEIPPAAEVAGWYRFGAAPGDAEGTVVIAAHVDSVASAGLGPFARLGDLAVGDAVRVTTADGAAVTYAVTGRSSVAKPEVAWGDVFTRDGGHRLVLVTCGGVWHEDRRSYSDNVIVTAEPIG